MGNMLTADVSDRDKEVKSKDDQTEQVQPTAPASPEQGSEAVSSKLVMGSIVLCDVGYGTISSIDEKSQSAQIELTWGGSCYTPLSQLRRDIALTISTFWEGADPCVVEIAAEPNMKIDEIAQKVADTYKMKVEEVRLVYRGRELLRSSNSQDCPTVSSCGILPPFKLLFVKDMPHSFEFSKAFSGSGLNISPDGKTVTFIGDGSRFHLARGTKAMTKGRIYWKIQIQHTQSGNIMIGVCDDQVYNEDYLGASNGGWGYGGGSFHNAGCSYSYGTPARTGDVIGVYLDMDGRSVHFSKNADTYKPAPMSAPLPDKVWPALSMYHKNDSVSLIEFGTF